MFRVYAGRPILVALTTRLRLPLFHGSPAKAERRRRRRSRGVQHCKAARNVSAVLYARHSGLVINLELGGSTTESDLSPLACSSASSFDLDISLLSYRFFYPYFHNYFREQTKIANISYLTSIRDLRLFCVHILFLSRLAAIFNRVIYI
ncbi:hypothetical protein ALC62_11787 [Cyphomyrmex costatus]|uniref:Uncharacterized protein n=1 Tax=Cyphomyrmex costatus TaxID=456900 RepID=A0A195C9F5_9HYME|nr:hypothetical protein ALC62_11787 [Cyphomyrmex costatus]